MRISIPNLSFILGGLGMLTYGIHRAAPFKMTPQFLWNTIPSAIAFVIIITLSIMAGGKKFLFAGIDGTIATTSSFFWILVLLMPIIGFSGPLAHHFEGQIGAVFKSAFGYPLAVLTAFGIPGGNMVSGIITRLWVTEHQIRPLLLYFLSIVPQVSFTIFFIRKLGLGPEISMAMYKTNWIISISLMPLFWAYGRFVYR